MLLYALGVVLCVEARRRTIAGTRVGGIIVVPALSGLLLIAVLAVVYGRESRYFGSRLLDRGVGVAAVVAIGVTAIAFGDLLVGRLTSAAGWLLRKVGRERADVALLIGVTLPVALALGFAARVEDSLVSGYAMSRSDAGVGIVIRASYLLSGHPMDLEFTSESAGYVTFGEGWIGRFELPPAGGSAPLRIRRVVDGLAYPRGLAVVGKTLFVAELGSLPCKPAFPSCKGGDIEGRSTEQTERDILRSSRARLIAFDIRADGRLTHRRVIITGLPVANSDHGVNDVAAGPDGLLYISIGNLDRLYRTSGLAPDLVRPHADLLGTVITIGQDGSDLTVFARGMRNVYGLTFDSSGRLYGVDNDGPTRSGWRREELLQIRRGADYGYPWAGTFAPELRRQEPPLWVVDAVGSSGIAWLDGDRGAGRVITGACSSVDSIELTDAPPADVTVASRADVTRIMDLPGCVTAVKRQGTMIALGVFAFSGASQLVLVDTRRL